MTDTSVLSKAAQTYIHYRARSIVAQSRQSARTAWFWTTCLAATAAAAAVVAPPALFVIAVAFPAAISFMAGTIAVGDMMNAKAMRKTVNDVGKEGFAEKLHKKTQKLSKLNKTSRKASFISGAGLASTVLGFTLFPPLTVLVLPMAIAVIVSSTLSIATEESQKNLNKIDARVQDLTQKKIPVAPASANKNTQSAGLKNTPSPAPTFKKAANGETPAAPSENKPTSPPLTSIKPR